MKIIKFPHKSLFTQTQPVTVFDEALHKELDEMHSLMKNAKGLGLAANQCELGKSMFVMQSKDKIYDVINPEIIEQHGKQYEEEGCLSAPNVLLKLERPEEVVLTAQDRTGQRYQVVATGIEAVCIIHEMEHLVGKAFYENANRQLRRNVERQLGIKK